MSMPFYVSPEQVMKDRADYARKGIARGRSLVALECPAGVLIVADNPSRSLSKISEIYDRIAFAAVGKYNEFQMLRVAGVRHADLKGYSYSREDVSAKELANALLNDTGVVTIGGPDFGVLGEGYIRLSYANSTENILKALDRMGQFLASRKAA